MDKIFLRELEIDAVIGIWEWERRVKQKVSVNLELAADARAAAQADSIDETLNYKDVAKRLIDYVGSSEFQLVESLAECCAEIIVREFGVSWLKLSVSKPGAIEGSRTVGITIERSAADYAD
ncbi:MAG TPA: dihydroneopterin aldolase [Gammaproteobacteria bacterium]